MLFAFLPFDMLSPVLAHWLWWDAGLIDWTFFIFFSVRQESFCFLFDIHLDEFFPRKFVPVDDDELFGCIFVVFEEPKAIIGLFGEPEVQLFWSILNEEDMGVYFWEFKEQDADLLIFIQELVVELILDYVQVLPHAYLLIHTFFVGSAHYLLD